MTNAELKNQFQIIEDRLNEAYESNDDEAISKLLADDWMILESSTGITTKEQFLNAIRNGNLIHFSMKKQIIAFRVYGDFAIVVSKGRNEGRYLGNTFNSEQLVTNIYRRCETGWICTMTQEVAVTC